MNLIFKVDKKKKKKKERERQQQLNPSHQD